MKTTRPLKLIPEPAAATSRALLHPQLILVNTMKYFLRNLLTKPLLAVTTLLFAFAGQALAQTSFASKPIRLIIPFPAGGAIDNFARTIGPELSSQLGQPVLIINKPGGGSQIAVADVLSSPADGHTVFVAQTGDFSVNPILYKNANNYLPSRDFDGVTMLLRAPQVMLANSSGKLNSLASFKTITGTRSETVLFGSFGSGTAPHLLGHLLSRSGVSAQFTHIPYKGFPPAMQALMTNEVDLLFDAVPGAINMMRTGKIVPLAVADTHRNSLLPNIPTTAEIGLPSLVMDFWLGVAVKKGTPKTIITQLHDAFQKAVASPENAKKFAELGYLRVAMSPEKFDNFIQSETAKMRPLIAESGATVD